MPGVQTSQTVLYCKMLAVKLNITFYTTDQPSKFLLGHHLASKSFGLGRLYCKSSRQLQNSTHHGDQNGCNLEWLKTAFFAIVTKKNVPCSGVTDILINVVNIRSHGGDHCSQASSLKEDTDFKSIK